MGWFNKAPTTRRHEQPHEWAGVIVADDGWGDGIVVIADDVDTPPNGWSREAWEAAKAGFI